MVDAGGEPGEDPQRAGHHPHRDRGHRELATRLLNARAEALAELLQLGDVRIVVLGDVRDGRPRRGQVRGGGAADAAHRFALHLPPTAEVGERRRGGSGAAGGRRFQQGARGAYHITGQDAPAVAGALHRGDVDAELAREAACVGGGRDRPFRQVELVGRGPRGRGLRGRGLRGRGRRCRRTRGRRAGWRRRGRRGLDSRSFRNRWRRRLAPRLLGGGLLGRCFRGRR